MESQMLVETFDDLRRRSPLFREMVDVVDASRVLTYVRPLRGSDRAGLMGQTRFSVGERRIVARVDVAVSRDSPRVRMQAMAHEIAHVVEVACLGHIPNQAALFERMQPQAARFSGTGRGSPMETRFAERIQWLVIKDLLSKAPVAGRLRAMTEREHLTACPVPWPDRPLMLAQQFETDDDAEGR